MPNGEDEFFRQEDAAKLARTEAALRIATRNLAEINDQRDMLAKSLAGALDLVNHLIDDLRHAGIQPSVTAVVAKAKLDAEMRALLARMAGFLITGDTQGG